MNLANKTYEYSELRSGVHSILCRFHPPHGTARVKQFQLIPIAYSLQIVVRFTNWPYIGTACVE